MAPTIEEAILIHRDGTFLCRYPQRTTTEIDWVTQARALLDMMDALGTTFDSAADALADLRFGDTTLHFTVGGSLLLVTVIRGRVGGSLARRLTSFLEELELAHWSVLGHWSGRPEALEVARDDLRRLVEGW